MQILTSSPSLSLWIRNPGDNSNNLCCNKPSRGSQSMLKFKNHVGNNNWKQPPLLSLGQQRKGVELLKLRRLGKGPVELKLRLSRTHHCSPSTGVSALRGGNPIKRRTRELRNRHPQVGSSVSRRHIEIGSASVGKSPNWNQWLLLGRNYYYQGKELLLEQNWQYQRTHQKQRRANPFPSPAVQCLISPSIGRD